MMLWAMYRIQCVLTLVITVQLRCSYADFFCDFGARWTWAGLTKCGITQPSSQSGWGTVSGHGSHGFAPSEDRNDGFLLTTGGGERMKIQTIFQLPNLNLRRNSGLLSFHYKFFNPGDSILKIYVCGSRKSIVNLQSDDNWELVKNIRIYCNGNNPTVTFTAVWRRSSGRVAVDNIRVVSTPSPITTTKATTTATFKSSTNTKRTMNTTTEHRTNTTEHTTSSVATSEWTRSSPRSTATTTRATTTATLKSSTGTKQTINTTIEHRTTTTGKTTTTLTISEWTRPSPRSSDLSTVEAVGPSVHISVTISIPVAIFLIIVVVGILTYHRLKHTGESPMRVTDRANEQPLDRALRNKSVQGATSRSLNAMPISHKIHCSLGTYPSVKNPLETSVGEVLYEDPGQKVPSATTADPEISHEYLVPFRDVPLKDSSSDHDYNYPDMPDVGLVQASVSARSTDEDGYIVMDRDPQGRTTAGSNLYYSSRIPRSQDGMGSSKIPGSEGYYSMRIPKSLRQEERGGSIENTDSHVYQYADLVKACNDIEDGAYIILDDN